MEMSTDGRNDGLGTHAALPLLAVLALAWLPVAAEAQDAAMSVGEVEALGLSAAAPRDVGQLHGGGRQPPPKEKTLSDGF